MDGIDDVARYKTSNEQQANVNKNVRKIIGQHLSAKIDLALRWND